MALLPIKIPSGFYRNATQYQAKNRWYNGNLVRFSEGRLRPIGGWHRLTNSRISKKGGISKLTITTAGTGYSAGTLSATGGGGSGFAGTYTVGGSGEISSVVITSFGTGYSTAPTIVISHAGNGNAVLTAETHGIGIDRICGLHSWRLSTGARYLAVGSTQSLRLWDGSQISNANSPLYDITPTDTPATSNEFHGQGDFLIAGKGYGALEYGGDDGVVYKLSGSGGFVDPAYTGSTNGGDYYGIPRYPAKDPDVGVTAVADINALRDNFAGIWSMDNFGDDLLACNSAEGTIWMWDVSNSHGGSCSEAGVTFTASSSGGLLITKTGHGLTDNLKIKVSSSGTLPTGLSLYTNYYVRDKTNDTFRLALSSGGTAIPYTNAGSGTHKYTIRTSEASCVAASATWTREATEYDNSAQTASNAFQLLNSPVSNVGVLVTAERHVMALGADGNKKKIAWSHQENATEWSPTVTNTAGDLTLQTKGRIIGGTKTRYGVLIFTTSDVWKTNYLGPPYVYGVERLTEGAGPIGAKCIAGSADFVAWMSSGRFWSYTGGYIQELQSEVGDYVFSDINRDVEGLICAGHNAEFGEITWFYPKEGDEVCTRYVTYSYREEHWTTGELERVAMESSDSLGYPVWAGSDGYLYRHEMDNDTQATPRPRAEGITAPSSVSALSTLADRIISKGVDTSLHENVATEDHLCFVESGAIEIGSGNQAMSVKQILTDIDAGDNGLRMKIKTSSTPDGASVEKGPYNLESDGYTDTRFVGRQALLRVESPFDQTWRFGEIRLDATASGKR